MMNLETKDAAWIVAVMLASCSGSLAVGFLLGFTEARARATEAKEAKAAADCPGCARTTDAARRLALVGARISGVEWFGKDRPEVDPCDDANHILRSAFRRVDALDNADPPPPTRPRPVARTGRRP